MEKRLFLTQLVAVANGAANNAALHIAAAFITRRYTVAHQERGSTNVVGNHFQRRIAQIGATRFTGSRFDQGVEQVDFVVAVHVLQNGSDTLQAHARIHAGRRQFGQATVFVHFKLHEYVVPNFDETVAVFIGRAWRAARNMVTVVVENLRARTARASVRHHPEVVALVLAAFVIANTDNAVFGHADDVAPNGVGFIVFMVHGSQQTLFGQAVMLGQQLPAPFDTFFFEVIAE